MSKSKNGDTGTGPATCCDLVPVTMSELWGPIVCKKCEAPCFTIWVERKIKQDLPFVEIYKHHGEARCDNCGAPNHNAQADRPVSRGKVLNDRFSNKKR